MGTWSKLEDGLEREMAMGDHLGSHFNNPGKGKKTAQESDNEIKQEVANVSDYRRNSTGLDVGLELGVNGRVKDASQVT